MTCTFPQTWSWTLYPYGVLLLWEYCCCCWSVCLSCFPFMDEFWHCGLFFMVSSVALSVFMKDLGETVSANHCNFLEFVVVSTQNSPSVFLFMFLFVSGRKFYGRSSLCSPNSPAVPLCIGLLLRQHFLRSVSLNVFWVSSVWPFLFVGWLIDLGTFVVVFWVFAFCASLLCTAKSIAVFCRYYIVYF